MYSDTFKFELFFEIGKKLFSSPMYNMLKTGKFLPVISKLFAFNHSKFFL